MSVGRRRLANLGLALVSLLVSLLAAEGGARAYAVWREGASLDDLDASAPKPGSEVVLGDILVPSRFPRLVYQLRSDLDVRFLGVGLRTNSDGWRAPEVDPREARGSLRLVFLGDSVTFGWGVEENERFADLLVERLRTLHPDRQWQPLVLAAPGYNLVMEMEALRRFGLDRPPDLLVYGYVSNDYCLPNFAVPRAGFFGPGSYLVRLLTESRFGALRLVRRGQIEAVEDVESELVIDRFCSDDVVPREYRDLVGRDSYHEAADELMAVARDARVPMLFLNLSKNRRVIDRGSVPEGARYVDALDARAARLEADGVPYEQSDLVLSPDDLHPSVLGHRLLAEALLDDLRDAGWPGRPADLAGTPGV